MHKTIKLEYTAPGMRVVDLDPELNFLQTGGDGNIDPGTDDPWGDY